MPGLNIAWAIAQAGGVSLDWLVGLTQDRRYERALRALIQSKQNIPLIDALRSTRQLSHEDIFQKAVDILVATEKKGGKN